MFPLITFPYVTRILSNDSYGRISFIDAFTGYFLIFSSLGIPYYGVREIAKVKNDPPRYTKLVIELAGLQLSLAIIFSAMFLIMQFFIPAIHRNVDLVKISCLIIIGSAFSIDWFFQGTENFTYITSRSLFTKTLNVISILIFVKASDDHYVYYLISGLTILINSSWNFYYFVRKFATKFDERLSIKPHIKPLLILFSINVSVSVYTVLDTIILGLFTNPATVSLYSVPLKLVKMFLMVVSGIGVVMIPRIASLFVNDDKDAITNLIKKSFNIIFLLTIPFSVFCMVFPKEILFVLSGQKYLMSAGALRVLALVPLIIGFCSVLGTQFLMPIGQENKILHATIIGLVISLLLNFLLIPHLKHIGASIACLAAETAVCIYIYFSARKRTVIQLDYRLLLHIGVSLTISVLAGVALRGHLHEIVVLSTSCASYVIIFILLQYTIFKNEFVDSLLHFKKLTASKV
ncbi:flippase [Mucilaginibacter jinjuensis]|uniref:Flippase n=1 Tax=Mucilaginibacter jinjuensis TaxID=1176721 RepID=A0ABY7TH44_9SPHI|nr:flippase [Mucilaginibacter jinjuensis]WCT14907.1 flippase [Mucilaginibacter jinjuensis]